MIAYCLLYPDQISELYSPISKGVFSMLKKSLTVVKIRHMVKAGKFLLQLALIILIAQ